MYIFTTINRRGIKHQINTMNFERLTYKEWPYMRVNKRKKYVYYAVCPECRDPVHISNLYENEKARKSGEIVSHARHSGGPISGFNYSHEDKLNCPLYKPASLGDKTVRSDERLSEEIKIHIDKNRGKIMKDIRAILGINLSTRLLESCINTFINAGAYRYRSVNKYNIPYCIMYHQQPILIFGQYIGESDEAITEAFKEKSRYFYLDERKIIKKPNVTNFIRIKLFIFNHRRKRERQYVQLKIYEETTSGRKRIIYNLVLEMTEFVYN